MSQVTASVSQSRKATPSKVQEKEIKPQKAGELSGGVDTGDPLGTGVTRMRMQEEGL